MPASDSGVRNQFAAGVAGALMLTTIAYWPVAGAGFQSDDFRWLWHARLSGWADIARIFGETLGFYRPFTQLLWAIDLRRAGPDPFAFFLTNLALHMLVLLLFAAVARRLLRDPIAAAAATVLAALSHHYNNMAVVWISGRGALLGAAAALAALWLWDRWCRGDGGPATGATACVAMAVGLGSYEAVAGVPLLMAAMVPYRGRGERPLLAAAAPLVLWAPYLWIRVAVGARQPWNEGQGYSYELAAVLPNVAEYSGRALVVAAGFILVLTAAALAARCWRVVAHAAAVEARDAAGLGLLWFFLGLLPALPVRNRSDLYVYFAAFGLHLILGAALVGAYRALRRQSQAATAASVMVATLLMLVVWPLFAWDRNNRIANQARLTMAAAEEIRAAAPVPGATECVVLVDNLVRRPNLHQALSDDLFWFSAYVFDEEPSYRVRYADDARGKPCTRQRRLVLAPDSAPVVFHPGGAGR